MVDSPHHPEQEVIFALSEAGVVDPEDGTKKKKSGKTDEPESEDEE
jgi:DNA repair protein RadA